MSQSRGGQGDLATNVAWYPEWNRGAEKGPWGKLIKN